MTTARGVITSRLLVNATVDPDEAATRLPDGLRPHITDDGAVVGCCLLEVAAIRPAGLPAMVGQHLTAAAHRMSVEWEVRSGATVTGVFVLARHTDSPLAVLLGGRWFPGIHQRAVVDYTSDGARLVRSIVPADPSLAMYVAATVPDTIEAPVLGELACACLDATVALSPGRRRPLEAARMETSHHRAVPVVVDELRSEFIDGFASAQPTTSYLIRDVDVVWSTDPDSVPVGASTR